MIKVVKPQLKALSNVNNTVCSTAKIFQERKVPEKIHTNPMEGH